jgi:hypothetical protein
VPEFQVFAGVSHPHTPEIRDFYSPALVITMKFVYEQKDI